jgi:hypothetical protein
MVLAVSAEFFKVSKAKRIDILGLFILLLTGKGSLLLQDKLEFGLEVPLLLDLQKLGEAHLVALALQSLDDDVRESVESSVLVSGEFLRFDAGLLRRVEGDALIDHHPSHVPHLHQVGLVLGGLLLLLLLLTSWILLIREVSVISFLQGVVLDTFGLNDMTVEVLLLALVGSIELVGELRPGWILEAAYLGDGSLPGEKTEVGVGQCLG